MGIADKLPQFPSGADHAIVGHAVFNVTPEQTGAYFHHGTASISHSSMTGVVGLYDGSAGFNTVSDDFVSGSSTGQPSFVSMSPIM